MFEKESNQAAIIAGIFLLLATFITGIFTLIEKGYLFSSKVEKPSTEQPSLDTPQKPLEQNGEKNISEFSTNNAKFKVFIQFYPSTKDTTDSIIKILKKMGFTIAHIDELREGQLHPQKMNLFFFSPESKKGSILIQDAVSEVLSINFSLLKSKYYLNPAMNISGSAERIF